ncbi:unnamed protein product [Ascophyllum nodosum]
MNKISAHVIPCLSFNTKQLYTIVSTRITALVRYCSLCTSAVSRNAGFWVPVSRQEDPLLQKIVVAKNLTLERPPFRDCYLYQYGVLPDQYLVPRADHAVSLHVSDKMDAKLPRSLVQMVASKSHRNGRQLSDRLVVSAWDGTMRNVTAPLLWRTQEPLF